VKTRIPVHSPLRCGSRIIIAEDARPKQEVWMTSRDYQIFEPGDVPLQSGLTLRGAQLAYKTYGRLDAAHSNVIVYPTSYGAQHHDTEWLIRPARALDPERYFIIIPNMLGNGLSSSPSNVGPPHDRGRFPDVTVADNVRMQHRLLTEQLGIERVALVYGWSMGGQQAYHWAALYPEMVERIAVVCGSARTAPHNQVFLESIKYALMADPAWRDGYFAEPPVRGLRAMGRIYAGWASAPRRQQFAGDDLDLAARRHQRQRALRLRFRQGARRDLRRRADHAEHDRPLFHGRRQRTRGRPHAACRTAPDPVDLGPSRRQPDPEP
jgi:pimeloyl-ACP methyl ester carboxylesterase